MPAPFLQRGGCRADCLGADLALSDLLAWAHDERPGLIASPAATGGPAPALERAAAGPASPEPLFDYGGRAFRLNRVPRSRIRGHFLGEDAAQGSQAAIGAPQVPYLPPGMLKPYTRR